MGRDGSGGLKGFIQELRRRKVFRVTALYLATAFGVLEAADILQDAMHLPGAFLPSVTILVILGFPMSLAVGWIFDVTSEGLKRTPEARPGEIGGSFSRWPMASLVLVTTMSLAAVGWTVRGMQVPGASGVGSGTAAASAGGGPADPDRAEFASIAVLPFLNLSGDPGDDYFGDGLAEELGNVLSRIDGLRVAARTSAFAFRDRQIDAKQIGDTLGVGMLLEGSVRRAGERVRIGAQLIRAADGLSLWSDQWNRQLTTSNVFAIQDDITRSIADELQRELLPDRERLAERRTTDLEAYDLYLLGRHHWAERSPNGLREAIQLFERALARDSTYALAWAGLADAWEARPFFDRSVSMAEAERVARPAAARALELAPELAEAHAAVGVILSDYDHDYPAATGHLRRAVELNPNDAQAWAWLCVAHTMGGDPENGLPACDRAVRLDPLSPVPRAQRALALMAQERYRDALEDLKSAESLGPLAWMLTVAMQRRLGEWSAIDDGLVRTAAAVGFDDPARMAIVADVIRRANGEIPPSPDPEALDVVHDLEAAGAIGFLELAPLYAWIGARSEALRVFREAVAADDPWLPFAGQVTSFDPLRDEPAFSAALDSLGIPNGTGRQDGGDT